MDSLTRLVTLAAATAVALLLAIGPVFAGGLAVEEPADAPTEQVEEGADESGKLELATTPDRVVGLVLLAFLGAIGVGGLLTMIRQLGGRRPTASGDFRWR